MFRLSLYLIFLSFVALNFSNRIEALDANWEDGEVVDENEYEDYEQNIFVNRGAGETCFGAIELMTSSGTRRFKTYLICSFFGFFDHTSLLTST